MINSLLHFIICRHLNLSSRNVSSFTFKTLHKYLYLLEALPQYSEKVCIVAIYQCLTFTIFGFIQMYHKVFVYGTLKRDEPNHNWLTDPNNGISNFVSEGITKTKYPLIIATKYNIPFLLYSPGYGNIVKGEVYEVDDKMLSMLDILEDHPNYYVREIDDIIIKKSENVVETMQCWVYFLKSFKRNLLTQPHMDNYSSDGPHGLPYLERSQRDPNYDYKKDTKD